MRRVLAATALLALSSAGAAQADGATALFQGRTTQVEQTLADPNDLWVSPADLARINGFEMKPEGLCYDQICIPVRPGDDSLVLERDGATWVNVTELARKLGQAFVADHDKRVWSFGPVPATMDATLGSAIAPDFEITDRYGKTVKLSDFRGKKVLLLTWASW